MSQTKHIFMLLAVMVAFSCQKVEIFTSDNNGEISDTSGVAVLPTESTSTGEARSVKFFKAIVTGTAHSKDNGCFGVMLSDVEGIPSDLSLQIPANFVDARDVFEVEVTNLKPGTRYYYQSFLQLSDTLLLGNAKSFKTEPLDKIITTGDYEVSVCGMTMHAAIDTVGTDNLLTEYGFHYGNSPDSLIYFAPADNLSDSQFISELHSIEGDKIYYAAYAKVGGWDVYGKAKLFEMPTWEYVVKYAYGSKVQIGEGPSLIWEKGDRVLVTDMKDTVSCFVSEQFAGSSSFVVSFRRFFSTPDLTFAFGDNVRLDNGNIQVSIPVTQYKYHLSLVSYGTSNNSGNEVRMYIMNSVSSATIADESYMLRLIFIGNENDAISGNYILSKDGLSPVAGQTESKIVLPYSGEGKYYFCCNPCTVSRPSFVMELDPQHRWDIVDGKVSWKYNYDFELSAGTIFNYGIFASGGHSVTNSKY